MFLNKCFVNVFDYLKLQVIWCDQGNENEVCLSFLCKETVSTMFSQKHHKAFERTITSVEPILKFFQHAEFQATIERLCMGSGRDSKENHFRRDTLSLPTTIMFLTHNLDSAFSDYRLSTHVRLYFLFILQVLLISSFNHIQNSLFRNQHK